MTETLPNSETYNTRVKNKFSKTVSEDASETWFDVPQEMSNFAESIFEHEKPKLKRQITSLEDCDDIDKVMKDINETVQKETKKFEVKYYFVCYS